MPTCCRGRGRIVGYADDVRIVICLLAWFPASVIHPIAMHAPLIMLIDLRDYVRPLEC